MRRFIFVVVLFLLAFCLCFGQADSLNMRRIGTWIAPDTVSFYGWPSTAFTVIGDKAFLGSGAGGGTIWQIDISDPTSPELDTVFVGRGSLGSWSHYLYAAGGRHLQVFDVTQTPPIMLAETTGAYAYNAADADSGYVVSFRWGWPSGWNIFDVSEPENPVVIFEIGGDYDWEDRDTYIKFPYAYITGYMDLYGDPDYDAAMGVSVLDLDTLPYLHGWGNLRPFPHGVTGYYPWSIVANESLIFVGADGATHVYSFDTLEGVQHLCSWNGTSLFTLSLSNGLLYGCSGYGTVVLDVCENACSPETVAYHPAFAADVIIGDSLLIGYGSNGIVILKKTGGGLGCQGNLCPAKDIRFSLLPNPAAGYTNLLINAPGVEVFFYDIAGRLHDRAKGAQKIDLHNFSPGLYLAVAHAGNQTYVVKLLVLA